MPGGCNASSHAKRRNSGRHCVLTASPGSSSDASTRWADTICRGYYLDFYCPAARLAVELDGFAHGLPWQQRHDAARAQLLAAEDIEELRFWNHQWRSNREGVLWEIWHALQRRTGCFQMMRKVENNRFVPLPVEKLGKKPERKPPASCKSE